MLHKVIYYNISLVHHTRVYQIGSMNGLPRIQPGGKMKRKRPVVVSTRVTEDQRVLIDTAATLLGVSPCEVLYRAAMPAVRSMVREESAKRGVRQG